MAILFHLESQKIKLVERARIKSWLTGVLENEGMNPGNISIILTNEDKLLELNTEFLSRDYHTDIITFDYTTGDIISGDIFISVDRIIENAEKFEDDTEMHDIARALVADDNDEEANDKLCELEGSSYIMEHWGDFIEMYLTLVGESVEIGISNSDIYSGNIGKRPKDNEWVLFDLGYNYSHNASEGVELELSPKEYDRTTAGKLKQDLDKLRKEHGDVLIREAGLIFNEYKTLGGTIFKYIV